MTVIKVFNRALQVLNDLLLPLNINPDISLRQYDASYYSNSGKESGRSKTPD